jgi:protein-tyrosine phosphatase
MTVSVAFVCLGNICRSPMADVIFSEKVRTAGLADRVAVASSGTANWHTGRSMDNRAAATLAAAGYEPSRHRARHFTQDWYAEHSLILPMDSSNYADVLDLAPTVEQQAQVRMFRSFDPLASASDCDVPDPYYGSDDGFTFVLDMIERTTDELLTHVRALA